MNTLAEEIKAMLAVGSGPLMPELEATTGEAVAQTPLGRDALEWAGDSSDDAIPETTYTLYRRYQVAGERRPYEAPYFEKRTYLTQAAVAAWLSGDDVHMDRVNDLIWSICEESTWVLPAHERQTAPYQVIDLFSAETGAQLAHVLLVLGDRLPEEVRVRIRREIEDRIMTPYLDSPEEYWWVGGRNNWTGVCAGSIGQVFLLIESDPARQAEALSYVLPQLERFIGRAFTADGASLEGIGYWNYGLIHYVALAEMLRSRTDGAIDLLAQERFRDIARYPSVAALDRHVFASFSDSHEHSSIVPFLGARLAERTGDVGLLAQVGSLECWRFTTVLRNLLWWDGQDDEEAVLQDEVMGEAAIVKFVSEAGGKRLVLAAKAGTNGEPHNNNDVGSFILRIGSVTYLCDPGGGLYSKDYFGPKRYENVFANSYGHSVPRIGGALQSTGENRRGTLEVPESKTAVIGYAAAYDADGLTEATRTITVQPDGTVTVTGSYAFDGDGLPVEEAFITWLAVEVDDSVARIVSDEGVLELRAEGAAFEAERLEEACRANATKETLTRITLSYPAASAVRTGIVATFHPKQ
ncbi:MAG: hypothetical protein GY851_06875 [bacterium]|nr:hypothetical protein [bacterium]